MTRYTSYGIFPLQRGLNLLEKLLYYWGLSGKCPFKAWRGEGYEDQEAFHPGF